MKNTSIDDMSFEQSAAKLDILISQLEKGELPLEEALDQFEQGIALVRHSQKKLSQAEQKISILLEANEETSLSEFTHE